MFHREERTHLFISCIKKIIKFKVPFKKKKEKEKLDTGTMNMRNKLNNDKVYKSILKAENHSKIKK